MRLPARSCTGPGIRRPGLALEFGEYFESGVEGLSRRSTPRAGVGGWCVLNDVYGMTASVPAFDAPGWRWSQRQGGLPEVHHHVPAFDALGWRVEQTGSLACTLAWMSQPWAGVGVHRR